MITSPVDNPTPDSPDDKLAVVVWHRFGELPDGARTAAATGAAAALQQWARAHGVHPRPRP